VREEVLAFVLWWDAAIALVVGARAHYWHLRCHAIGNAADHYIPVEGNLLDVRRPGYAAMSRPDMLLLHRAAGQSA